MAERLWRSTCPHCGAPVELRSAATAVAVCSFCRSTLAREGEALRRLGQSAELFDDHSPLQVGAGGRWNHRAFGVIGRLQWRTAEAAWNEWQLLFDGGAGPGPRAWLSEDNGRYVLAVDRPLPAGLPPDLSPLNTAAAREALLAWQAGQAITLDGNAWSVASVVSARIAAAEGELDKVPVIDERVSVVDLRDAAGQVATLAASGRELSWSIGQGVELAALALTGLRDVATKEAATRGVTCPSCGTALAIKLETTKTIACHQCKAVVDVSQGVGGDLDHYRQVDAKEQLADPLLPLGATGKLALGGAAATWQVVGYMVRQEVPGPDDDPELPWTEYLLYSREIGFAFLVNSDEGWAWAVPITGAPEVSGVRADWAGRSYKKRYDYVSKVRYVLGEFYWQVRRDQRTSHTDYARDTWRLNREQQDQEVTWSDGQRLPSQTVMQAFGIKAPKAGVDVRPLASSGFWSAGRILMLIAAVVLLIVLMSLFARDPCDNLRRSYGAASVEYQQCVRSTRSTSSGSSRSSGGSWGGGSSSSGSHK